MDNYLWQKSFGHLGFEFLKIVSNFDIRISDLQSLKILKIWLNTN